MQNIRLLSQTEISQWLSDQGQQKFRAQQVWEWLWLKHAHSFADMTNLSKDLREKLGQNFSLPALTIDTTQLSSDGTLKSRFRTYDGHFIEGVLIPTEKDKRFAFLHKLVVALVANFAQPAIWIESATWITTKFTTKW